MKTHTVSTAELGIAMILLKQLIQSPHPLESNLAREALSQLRASIQPETAVIPEDSQSLPDAMNGF
jgi:hypothetical protein